MSRQLFEFAEPERVVVGTVGPPGEREFFIQARQGRRLVTVAIEKSQARVLAEGLDRLLDELFRAGVSVPMIEPGDLDLEPLTSPIESEFRSQAMGLAWNETLELLTLEVHSEAEEDTVIPDVESDAEEGPDCLRVRLTLFQARAFVARTLRVVSAGRQPCPFCQLPLNPAGHVCPRSTGYRR